MYQAMRITTFFVAIFLLLSVCLVQAQTTKSEAKNKIVLKVSGLQKDQDVLVMDRILSQCKNIYYSKTNFQTGFCELIADKTITVETINNDLLSSGYSVELVSTKPISEEEIVKEGMINNYINKQKK
jgi:hypothetical protein